MELGNTDQCLDLSAMWLRQWKGEERREAVEKRVIRQNRPQKEFTYCGSVISRSEWNC